MVHRQHKLAVQQSGFIFLKRSAACALRALPPPAHGPRRTRKHRCGRQEGTLWVDQVALRPRKGSSAASQMA